MLRRKELKGNLKNWGLGIFKIAALQTSYYCIEEQFEVGLSLHGDQEAKYCGL